MSQDCGFSLDDPLHETHRTKGHPALVRGHGIVLEYYVVLCLVRSASQACPLCHNVSQDCGFSLEDPLHETHCIGGHSTVPTLPTATLESVNDVRAKEEVEELEPVLS